MHNEKFSDVSARKYEVALRRINFHSVVSDQARGVNEEIFLILVGRFVALLFYVHGKHLRSCRDGQLT